MTSPLSFTSPIVESLLDLKCGEPDCEFAFSLREDEVCVSPFHDQRVELPGRFLNFIIAYNFRA